MNKTKIEWVKNPDGTQGYTWNPITGCLNGCEYCYARELANTRLKDRYQSNPNIAIPRDIKARDLHDLSPKLQEIYRNDPFYPRFWPERLDAPSKHKKPAGIFACDMSDLFGIVILEKWSRAIIRIAVACPQHTFMFLTKQPQNLAKFSPFPDNCWVGVSATNPEMARMATINLHFVEAKVKYLSIEPLLSGGDENGYWKHIYYAKPLDAKPEYSYAPGIDWIIIGAQTKPTVMPKIEWVEEIERAADQVGIPVFEKNNLKPLLKRELRQEMPNDTKGK